MAGDVDSDKELICIRYLKRSTSCTYHLLWYSYGM